MKRAFTLSEILIALAIIGVIVAITLPTLLANIQNRTIGPALSKANNMLSEANTALLSTKGSSSLGVTTGYSSSEYVKSLIKYAQLVPYPNDMLPEYKAYTGSLATNAVTSSSSAAIAKDGVLYIFTPVDETTGVFASKDGVITGIATSIEDIMGGNNVSDEYSKGGVSDETFYAYVDVNGVKAPNRLGKDLFLFVVADDGAVIPYGGKAYNLYRTAKTGKTYSTPMWAETFSSCNSGIVSNGKTCAGFIADSDWQVLY